MTFFVSVKELKDRIPVTVRTFLIRAFCIFVVWKVLYYFWLQPMKFPDKPLTHLTAQATAWLYSATLHPATTTVTDVSTDTLSAYAFYVNQDWALVIADPCNGLELFVTYLGFLFCLPASLKKRLNFIFLGILTIFVLNILRCYGLAWLNLKNIAFADFAHHYLFKMVVYAGIFGLWVVYSSKYFKYGK